MVPGVHGISETPEAPQVIQGPGGRSVERAARTATVALQAGDGPETASAALARLARADGEKNPTWRMEAAAEARRRERRSIDSKEARSRRRFEEEVHVPRALQQALGQRGSAKPIAHLSRGAGMRAELEADAHFDSHRRQATFGPKDGSPGERAPVQLAAFGGGGRGAGRRGAGSAPRPRPRDGLPTRR